MATSSTPYTGSPSSMGGSSSTDSDYTSSSTDDTLSGSDLSSTSSIGGSDASMSSSMAASSGTPRPDLMERVVRGAHETVDKLADKAKPQLQRLQEGAGSASDTLHAQVDHARELTDEWAESLRATVRENPLAAVGTALALGLIVARLSR